MADIPEQEPGFGIGAVSRLTGIPLDTLRVWERRHRLVAPRRADGNQRRYSREDVARLGLVKQLVDLGHAISAVAPLGEEALRERLRLHQEAAAAPRPAAAGRPLRVLVQGEALPLLAGEWQGGWEGLELAGGFASWEAFERAAAAQRPDVLVAEMPALQAERAARLARLAAECGAARAVVVYGFARGPLLERLRRDGIAALRAPADAESLARACRPGGPPPAPPPVGEPVPPRRFGGADLAAVARMPTGIRCECPRHLADLLSRLAAFEDYSADCESRSEEDAELHARLRRETARARALLEAALEDVLRREGVELAALRAGG